MKKFRYGVLAFTPLIEVILSVVLMIVSIVLMIMAALGSVNASVTVLSVLLWVSIAGIMVGIVLCIAGAVIFAAHAKKNERLDDTSRGKWVASLICLVCFAFPVYWWKYIR